MRQVRTPRADAQRNRGKLLSAAIAALTEDESVPLDAIARRAGVGIGTLYRHFPTRDALIEAAYRTELDKVCAEADRLATRYPPVEALQRWMTAYARFVRTKRGMIDSLRALMDSGAIAQPDTRARIRNAMARLLAAGVADGTMRADVDPDDATAALVGTVLAGRDPRQTARLQALLLDALRAP